MNTPAVEIALFPLNLVLFPGGPLPLRIFETRYVDMVRRCLRDSVDFGVALIREGQEVGPAQTFEVGTLAAIVDFHQLADGFLGLSCTGKRRFRITGRRLQADGLHLATVEWLAEEAAVPMPPRHAGLAELLESVLPQLGGSYTEMPMHLDDASWVGFRLAEILPIPGAQKQYCLELEDPLQRLDFLGPLTQATA